jgi:predicted Zn finger-like uncharacterized protein
LRFFKARLFDDGLSSVPAAFLGSVPPESFAFPNTKAGRATALRCMKFLCPSCKAKYQIADEKVAGRSVRMKCRKCGFMIQVSSAIASPAGFDSEPPEQTEGDAFSLPPPAVQEAPAKSAPLAAAPAPAPAPAAPVATAPSPAAPSVAGAPNKAPLPKATGISPRLPPAKAKPAAAPAAAPKPATPPPRASVPRAAVPAVAGPVTSAKSSPLAAVRPLTAPRAAEAPAVAEHPRDFDSEEEVTRMASAGALAGAFTQAFGGGAAPASTDAPLSMHSDEWFVGINGVPVGPIRLSELRSKAASGAVTKESLVWRDGFEDWRPLKTYPELLAIVEEGVSSARSSLTPFMPLAEANDLLPNPSAVAADPFARAPSPSAVTGSAVVTDEIAGLLPPRRGTSPMVWVAMVIAIGLGLTMGFVLFGGKPETKIVEKIVEKEVPVKGADPGPAAANNAPGGTILADPQAPKKQGGTAKAPSATPTTDAKPLPGLSGLNGLNNLGPASGPAVGGPSGATGGGAQLESGQIQSTVARYTGSVKRRCWQPALDARAKDAPMTAKVTVTITVGPSGSVQNASASGEPKGYPGLANCIASSVRSWSFPASGGTTIANVPFVFAGQ